MFITNALVVMRTWADAQQLNDTNEDWDSTDEKRTTKPTTGEIMRTAAHSFFVALADYLKSAVAVDQQDRLSEELEFHTWRRIVTNNWTMTENVCSKSPIFE